MQRHGRALECVFDGGPASVGIRTAGLRRVPGSSGSGPAVQAVGSGRHGSVSPSGRENGLDGGPDGVSPSSGQQDHCEHTRGNLQSASCR